MKTAALLLAGVGIFAVAVSADERPRVSRGSIAAAEKALDRQLNALWRADPVDVVAVTQGSYLDGYGAVFMSEVNLAPSAGISPFHPAVSKEEVARIHQKKMDRVNKFRDAVQEMLIGSAASLDGVPGEQEVAISISLFYWPWENTSGLPGQIVMHAQRGVLAGVQSGKTDRALLASALKVQVY